MIKFSEDQQMIMDLAREIAEENIKPLASKYDQEEKFDHSTWEAEGERWGHPI